MKKYGLIGKSLKHSFSRDFFTARFKLENISAEYHLLPIEDISDFLSLLEADQTLCGLNVTFPFKQQIIPYLNELSPIATLAGAVNTVKITRDSGKLFLKGYNTDVTAFNSEVTEKVGTPTKRALILGTGGAAAAASLALQQLGWEFRLVSRHKKSPEWLLYTELNEKIMQQTSLIVNATPLGTFPNTDECPLLPWQHINSGHFLFDMVYNPPETLFIQHGKQKGAKTTNGLGMLHKQAALSWEIWNEP
ncbi:shikimate dehydrogenase [Lentimicrobium sp.]